MYSFGLIIGFFFCSKVSAAKISWRTYYLFSIGLAFLDFCIQTFYLESDLSIQHMLNLGLEKSVILKKLERYLTKNAALELYQEFAESTLASESLLSSAKAKCKIVFLTSHLRERSNCRSFSIPKIPQGTHLRYQIFDRD